MVPSDLKNLFAFARYLQFSTRCPQNLKFDFPFRHGNCKYQDFEEIFQIRLHIRKNASFCVCDVLPEFSRSFCRWSRSGSFFTALLFIPYEAHDKKIPKIPRNTLEMEKLRSLKICSESRDICSFPLSKWKNLDFPPPSKVDGGVA